MNSIEEEKNLINRLDNIIIKSNKKTYLKNLKDFKKELLIRFKNYKNVIILVDNYINIGYIN